MIRRWLWALALVCATALPVAAARFVDLPSDVFQRTTYVSLDALLRALNGSKRYDGALEMGTLSVAGTKFSFVVGSRVVRSGDRTWNLLAPVISEGGTLWATADLVNDVLAPGASISVSLDGARLLLTEGAGIQVDVPPSPHALPTGDGLPHRVRRIVIDPSHGGGDEGAALPGGVSEKWASLELARALSDELSNAGYIVSLTRNEDRSLSPEARAAFANQSGADLFLSLGAATWSADDDGIVWIVVHGTVGQVGGPRAVAGFPLQRWDFVQQPHLAASASLAGALSRTVSSEVARVPLRVIRGVDMPAVMLLYPAASTEKRRWPQWRSDLARDVVRAVQAFERGSAK
jgi:N-acetylmuramoyl-L-alanine amidase